MLRSWLLLAFAIAFVGSSAHAAVVEHTFNVGTVSLPKICEPGNLSTTAVNGQVPGPKIEAHEGDTVVIHVVNNSPYNVTVHWHGIFQRGTPWADGPEMVTQCPIRPGFNYTYRFNVTGQEGTLWWHAHSSFMRATVYGSLIILPRRGAQAYPFPRPHKEEIILLGEWWNNDTVLLERDAFLRAALIRAANAYTINGEPGDSYNCSTTNRIAKFEVRQNATYLLRIINAALNTPFFYKVENHRFTVVAVDASYTTPYETNVIVIAPGQTVDALMVADASPGRYYMAISPYLSSRFGPPTFNGNTTRAIVEYVGAPSTAMPVPPDMPPLRDTNTAHRFYTNLTALVLPGRPTVPLTVDTHMFVTFGLGRYFCVPAQTLCFNSTPVFAGSMNNISFELPTRISMLEAQYRNESDDVYTRDFPDQPPVVFDYTNPESNTAALWFTEKHTKVRTLKYNTTVEMVLQNTALITAESHPMHIHGFNFFVLAQGFGNYDSVNDPAKFNLVNPQERNTISVPTGGWAVIRFLADNPGMWFVHCHFDDHLPIGLGMVFEVENGPTRDTAVPDPPADLPQC